MNSALRFSLSAFGAIVLAHGASAGPAIAHVNFTGVAFGAAAPVMEILPFITYGDPGSPGGPTELGNATIDIVDISNGNYKTLTGDFAGFAAAATNGDDETLFVGFRASLGSGDFDSDLESFLYSPAAPGVGLPDLSGYVLTGVRVLGTSFSALDNGGTAWGLEFEFLGRQIPAPGGAALLALSALTTVRRRR